MAAADRLEELEPPTEVKAEDGAVALRLELPMPSVSAIVLTPV